MNIDKTKINAVNIKKRIIVERFLHFNIGKNVTYETQAHFTNNVYERGPERPFSFRYS